MLEQALAFGHRPSPTVNDRGGRPNGATPETVMHVAVNQGISGDVRRVGTGQSAVASPWRGEALQSPSGVTLDARGGKGPALAGAAQAVLRVAIACAKGPLMRCLSHLCENARLRSSKFRTVNA